jgi:hypothetical protein
MMYVFVNIFYQYLFVPAYLYIFINISKTVLLYDSNPGDERLSTEFLDYITKRPCLLVIIVQIKTIS